MVPQEKKSYYELDPATGTLSEVELTKRSFGTVTLRHISDVLAAYNASPLSNAPVIFPYNEKITMLVHAGQNGSIRETAIMWAIDNLPMNCFYALQCHSFDAETREPDPSKFYLIPDIDYAQDAASRAVIQATRTIPFHKFNNIKLIGCLFWSNLAYVSRRDATPVSFLCLAIKDTEKNVWNLKSPFLPNVYDDSKVCYGANTVYSNYCDREKSWSAENAIREFEKFLSESVWNKDLFNDRKRNVMISLRFKVDEDELFHTPEETEQNLMESLSYYYNANNTAFPAVLTTQMFEVFSKWLK